METDNILDTKHINDSILNIWDAQFREGKTDLEPLVPLIYPALKKAAILFVSLNPSFNAKSIKTILKDIQISRDPADYFHWNNINVFLENAVQIEKRQGINITFSNSLTTLHPRLQQYQNTWICIFIEKQANPR